MPNSRESKGTDPLSSVGITGSATPPEPVAAPDSAAAVASSGAVAGGEPVQAAPDIASPQAIAAALANGTIDGPTAQRRLIEAAVRARVPPGTSDETIAAIRAEVEAMVGDHPALQSLLRV